MQGTASHFAKIYLIDFADGDLVTNFLAGFLQLLDHFAFSLLQLVITLIGNICVVGSAAFPNFGSNYLMPNSRGLQMVAFENYLFLYLFNFLANSSDNLVSSNG